MKKIFLTICLLAPMLAFGYFPDGQGEIFAGGQDNPAWAQKARGWPSYGWICHISGRSTGGRGGDFNIALCPKPTLPSARAVGTARCSVNGSVACRVADCWFRMLSQGDFAPCEYLN